MLVTKRNGSKEPFVINKVINRIANYKYEQGIETEIILNLNHRLYNRIPSSEIDNLISEIAISLINVHPNYGKLASNILLNNIYKEVGKSFSETMTKIYEMKESLVAEDVHQIIESNKEIIDAEIDHDNDLNYDYFSFKAIQYHLIKKDGKVVERPQHMLMRVAIGIHKNDIASAIETYKLMSQRWFIHDSTTLLNAGTPQPVLSSSYLVTIKDDSLPGIYDTLKQTAVLLKKTNDIGLNVHCIRSADSFIHGSNGYSNGLVTMLKVFNESSNYMCQTDQNGNRQKEMCIYLEPWHADIVEFLDLKRSIGEANLRARDLLYALWIPDLFMQRVKDDIDWSLMCPNQSPGLQDVHGDEFVKLYEHYEKEGKFRRKIKARELWNAIVSLQIETGSPYMLYKDSCNRKSNQQNIGTIKCSNLSTEVLQYSGQDEMAVCQSASIALHKFVDKKKQTYDFNRLKEITKIVTRNLNKMIDNTFYPLPETKLSNQKHRPISCGVSGLAETFMLLGYPFDSEEAQKLNIQIFETIYYGALEASCLLAEKDGPYETYEESPVSKGTLQYDMWNVKPTDLWNWTELKQKIAKHGLRNSLLVAPLTSCPASDILGCNNCCDPIISISKTRKIINSVNLNDSKNIVIVNPFLLNDLMAMDQWSELMMEEVMQSDSVQNIIEIPNHLKQIYKNAFEISQKTLINMIRDRAPFIDQSQALNIYMTELSFDKITSMHFYCWQNGLKSGLYKLHSSIQNKFPLNSNLIRMSEKKKLGDKTPLCTSEKQFKIN